MRVVSSNATQPALKNDSVLFPGIRMVVHKRVDAHRDRGSDSCVLPSVLRVPAVFPFFLLVKCLVFSDQERHAVV